MSRLALAPNLTSYNPQRAPFKGIFFETRGVNLEESKKLPFSFVLINSPVLHKFGNRGSDIDSFSKQFCLSGEWSSVVFNNLGGDAKLIAPRPPPMKYNHHQNQVNLQSYSHLAKFVRNAPEEQVDHFFAIVAKAYLERLRQKSPEPVWLSTSGLGVAWLHFRLDSSPKYYQFDPYRKA